MTVEAAIEFVVFWTPRPVEHMLPADLEKLVEAIKVLERSGTEESLRSRAEAVRIANDYLDWRSRSSTAVSQRPTIGPAPDDDSSFVGVPFVNEGERRHDPLHLLGPGGLRRFQPTMTGAGDVAGEELAQLVARAETQTALTDQTSSPTSSPAEQATEAIGADMRAELVAAAAAAGVDELGVDLAILGAQQEADAFGVPVEDLLQRLIENWEAQALQTGPTPIGVERGFVAQRPLGFEPDLSAPGSIKRIFQDIQPRYFEGDEYSPAGLDPVAIIRYQKRLEQAGLLEPGAYWAGVWDSTTAAAYKSVLGMSNQSGRGVDAMIDQLVKTVPDSIKEQRARAELAKQFQAPPYIAPDPATLAQAVKSTVRAQLGREPSEAEMAQLTGHMSRIYRADFEAEVAAASAAFDAGQASLETGTVQAPASVAGVDPAARFRQIFEEKYRPEIDFIQAKEATVENMGNVYESLRTMSSLVSGR